MFETQIEKLTEHIAAVGINIEAIRTEQGRTNGLLGEILTAIRESGTNPPPPARVAETKAKPISVRKSRANKPVAIEKQAKGNTTKEGTAKETPPTLENLREAYISFVKQHGKDVQHGKDMAVGMVRNIAGDVQNITHVPEDRFADIIAAFQSHEQKEAA